jgi:hypothetical protein
VEEDTVTLQLFNLPYAVSQNDIVVLLGELSAGAVVLSVVIKMDKKRNLPAGAVAVELRREGVDTEALLALLREKDLGGRKIRAELSGQSRRRPRPSSEGSRYFGADMSCKCFLCGEVGHKSQECGNDPLPTPCGLCAGLDHESGACPNITCYRCGKFGHHSRVCGGARMSKAAVCTECGSATHESRACPNESKDFSGRFEGPKAVCMSCGELGHLCCRVKPRVKGTGRVYCHNCGREGHLLDSVGDCECVVPRIDAYIKFSSLANADPQETNQRELNHLYRDLVRGSNYYFEDLLSWFPSLKEQPQQPRDEGRAREVATSYGSSSGYSRRVYSEDSSSRGYDYGGQERRSSYPYEASDEYGDDRRGSTGSRSRIVSVSSSAQRRDRDYDDSDSYRRRRY